MHVGEYTEVNFTRKLVTGDRWDCIYNYVVILFLQSAFMLHQDDLTSSGDVVFKWAYGEGIPTTTTFKQYTARGEIAMNFFGGGGIVNFFSNYFILYIFIYSLMMQLDEMSQIKAHGILMVLIVMLMMTSSIVLARYLKVTFYYWFYVHTAILSLAIVLLIVSVVVVFKAHGSIL